MRIFHTADWHLGQNLYEKRRIKEHKKFFGWILDEIQKRKIDVLVISGDIYDNGNPPNYAKEELYSFLAKLLKTNCRNVIIVGGNHDSVSMLNAPQKLLSALNISILGGASEKIEDEIIEIKNKNNEIEMVICAVPFLRDSDIHYTFVSDLESREKNIKDAITAHYNKLAKICSEKYSQEIPIIATGHLYAAKASSGESEKDIYIGNLGKIRAEQFPKIFKYIALGHLHREQRVNKQENIRYSGSPLAMTFSENSNQKYLIEIELEKDKISRIERIKIPVFRKLLLFKDNFDNILQRIKEHDFEGDLISWCEIQILDKETLTTEEKDLIDSIKEEKEIDILAIKTLLISEDLKEEKVDKLDDLNIKEVFRKRCDAAHLLGKEINEIEYTFEELLDIMNEKKTL